MFFFEKQSIASSGMTTELTVHQNCPVLSVDILKTVIISLLCKFGLLEIFMMRNSILAFSVALLTGTTLAPVTSWAMKPGEEENTSHSVGKAPACAQLSLGALGPEEQQSSSTAIPSGIPPLETAPSPASSQIVVARTQEELSMILESPSAKLISHLKFLGYTPTAEELGRLVSLPNLQSVDLRGTEVIDVSALGGVTNLNLTYTHVTDVSALGGVTNLNLSYTKVTNVSVLENVRTLDLSGCRHLGDLSVLRGVHTLNLYNTCVAAESLLSLIKAPGLRKLTVHNHPQYAAVLERFRQQRPDVEITREY
jgi:hypothetical protein